MGKLPLCLTSMARKMVQITMGMSSTSNHAIPAWVVMLLLPIRACHRRRYTYFWTFETELHGSVSLHLVVIRRAHETLGRSRRPNFGVVAPGRTGNLYPRPFRAVVPHRALEPAVLFGRRGRGGGCGTEADIPAGAGVAHQSVRVGSVGARRALVFY